LQRFQVEWQGKSSQKGISLILNRLIPQAFGALPDSALLSEIFALYIKNVM
jgi:hypothetical protein